MKGYERRQRADMRDSDELAVATTARVVVYPLLTVIVRMHDGDGRTVTEAVPSAR